MLYRHVRYLLVSVVVRLLPLRRAYELARWYGRRVYRRRRPMLASRAAEMEQRLAATADQVDAWLTRHFELRASELLDWHLIARMRGGGISRLIDIRGLENLASALERGRGAILYSGHVTGDWTLFAALAARGFPINMMGRFLESPDRLASARLSEFMAQSLGVRFLQIREGDLAVAVRAQKALRENGVVTIEIDQSNARQRVEARFLGGQAWFPSGLVEIARSSGAPLLDFWVERPDTWQPQIGEIGPPFHVDEDTDAAVQQCAAALERSIVRDPASWRAWTFSRMLVWESADQLQDP